jgi:hypothetical protein
VSHIVVFPHLIDAFEPVIVVGRLAGPAQYGHPQAQASTPPRALQSRE